MNNDITMRLRGMLYREAGIAKRVERALVTDDDGNAVMLVKETTEVVVENEDRSAVRVQTAVSGVVMGNVLNQQVEPIQAIEAASPTPTVITQPSHEDIKECFTWCCCIKWTLITILCLPFLPLICLYNCCCKCCCVCYGDCCCYRESWGEQHASSLAV